MVDGVPVVVEGRSLEDDTRGANHHGYSEDPEEQTVQHHGHVLPVFQDLVKVLHFTERIKKQGRDIEGLTDNRLMTTTDWLIWLIALIWLVDIDIDIEPALARPCFLILPVWTQ